MGYRAKLRTLNESKFFKNVVAMISGTTLAQLFPLLVSPILTRYYSEADFGLMGSITSMSDIIAVAICGRYQLAIMLPKSIQKAYSISILSIFIAFISSTLLLIIVLVYPTEIENFIGVAGVNKWLIFIPFTVFVIGLWNTLNIWISRAANFKINAISKIIQSSSNATVSVLLSKISNLYFTAGGLIVGRISGFTLSSINMLNFFAKDIKRASLKIDIPEIKSVAKKYLEYPKYNLVPALLNTISNNALFLVIGKFYSIESLGHYNLANISLIAPVALIAVSIRDILYQRFTNIIHEGKSPIQFFAKSAKWLLIVGSPVFFIPLIAGPFLFSFVFGENWVVAGQFAAILSITYWVKLIVSPLSSIFNSIGKIRIASYWQTAYFITSVLTLGTVAYNGISIENLFIVYVIHELIMYGIYFILEFYHAKRFTINPNVK